MPKPRASRTVNPLHFEDLEPHRFEDLIRQLAYGFRTWTRLEATGRLGGDEGTDIRGLELVTGGITSLGEDPDDGTDESAPRVVLDEREWRIQCKRYKTIGPKLMRQIVAEAVPDAEHVPYGLIIAAACDVSASTIAAFHNARINLGVPEGHLWTKAHLEDLLFLPQNDHLLFAYFGLSLGTRRHSELQKVRAVIATKRKLLRAFELDDLRNSMFQEVIVRDVLDTTYPKVHYYGTKHIFDVPPWLIGTVLQPYEFGLMVSRYTFKGWVKKDGTWDVVRDSAWLTSNLRFDFYDRLLYGDKESDLTRRLDVVYNEHVPAEEKADISMLWSLPYEAILEVDPIGDNLYEAPHLFCLYAGEGGPFGNVYFYSSGRHGESYLTDDKQAPLFKHLFSAHLSAAERRKVRHLVKVFES
jgi:hypothetical protein